MFTPTKEELRALKGIDVLQYARTLKAISNPARLWILTLLIDKEKNVRELEELTGMNQPNVSRCLQSLMRNGLVIGRKDGVRTYYAITNDENIIEILYAVGAIVRKRQAI